MSSTEFDAIIDDLGGLKATARALGRSSAQICQWRARYGQFPADMYLVLLAALQRKRARAPMDRALAVCRFEQPQQHDELTHG